MYALLAPSAMATISADKFISRYRAIADEASITALTASVTSVQRTLAAAAVVSFILTVDTRLAGQFQIENRLDLAYAGQRWGVEWASKTIFPMLLRDNLVHMFIQTPSRGSILDRRDRPLAAEGQVVEVGVVTGQIKDEAQLLAALSALLGLSEGSIQARYQAAGRPDWFMPVGEITPEAAQFNKSLLSADSGIVWREKAVRMYPYGGMASHVIGYLAEVDAAGLALLEPKGYRSGDLVGAFGLEAWGEQYLAGGRGGTLAIISQEGRIVWTLAERPAQTSQNIHTAMNLDLQLAVESILGQRVGAIVAVEVNTGEVLAMASYPGFNPQVLTGGATSGQWQALLGDAQRPLLNRAVAGIYPPGSAFKIVTLSAALDALGLNARSPFYCAGRWDGLDDGAMRYCWLKTGHGPINLFEGMVQSCDTVFWEVGKALNEVDPMALSRYARGFGLGAATGIKELDEAQGLIPDPEWKRQNYSGAEQAWLPRDAVNMAIGQGDVLVTPLQMASLCAAVANGGTLFRPRLVRRVGTALGADLQAFAPEASGRLPVSAVELQLVQSAMESVVIRGTASNAFRGASVRMAGKSGTAEAPPGETHAWFVGYAPADAPQIAVAVVLEHGGEGGGKAAPLFRQVVESYLALPR